MRQRSSLLARLALLVLTAVAAPVLPPLTAPAAAAATVAGIDVSRYQPSIDWSRVASAGYRFAYIAAADGTVQNPYFAQQMTGAKNAGLLRGAYFFAEPVFEAGATHAGMFLDQVGYRADGWSLPPVLDVEQNPYQGACDGLSSTAWINYIAGFGSTVKSRTGQDVVIYASPNFWRDCVADTTRFSETNPLWIAHYGVSAPSIPGGWPWQTFWQYTSTGTVPGISGSVDLDVFNGSYSQLKKFAPSTSTGGPPDVLDYPWAGLTIGQGGDQWGMGYGQCVSFAAWMAYKNNGGDQHPASIPARGWFPSNGLDLGPVREAWGNAGDWSVNAKAAGYVVDGKPHVGAVAQWDNGSNRGTFTVGHVAYVTAVDADGSIELAQYNLREDSAFSTLRMTTAGADDTSNGHPAFHVSWPDHFIHLGDQNFLAGQ
ncbi:GH25 family lysozyme [Krasilnikovia sp. MM14-A1259]|uniref:GH25 family lysozyme n=1 Tax=Krasilnikovia sp. MM14-A1259 TaxID=3373539 RepID=UPI00380B16BF